MMSDVWALTTHDNHPTTDRPVAWTPWPVPYDLSLTDDGEHIRWSRWTNLDPDEPDMNWVAPPASHHGAGLLSEFSRLADATPAQVLTFARRWGPLALCAHGLPHTHSRSLVHPGTDSEPTQTILGCEPASDGAGGWTDPVAEWRRLARDVRHVGERMSWINTTETGYGFADASLVVRSIVNGWVDAGRVRPSLAYSPADRLTPTIGGDGLFGALALQLLLGVSNWRGLAVCSSCSTVFAPRTKPRPGERQWCADPACQRSKRAAAAADYRRRMRARTTQ